uniref:Predicted transcriptional regulators n=1 Tax=uncultured myxobacterium HF0200_01L06 TaxID=723556 RepID=E7C3J2_9BACT|nr:predicted transcriptional regulators [uncultured myxobacterium HF0200_01L06]
MQQGIGELLRYWRDKRGLTQFDLADRSGISCRHLSFVETGRAGPSRQTILTLARVLEIPSIERSRILILAGYAVDWLGPEEEAVEWWLTSLEGALAANEPFPAWITDPNWKFIRSNPMLQCLLSRCSELNPELKQGEIDIIRIFEDSRSLGAIVQNWAAVVESVVAGLFRLQPDPATSDWTAPLYQSVTSWAKPGHETLRQCAERSDVRLDFDDQGYRFSLHVNALPLCGRCSGYVLALMSPADAESQEVAIKYFDFLSAGTANF